MKKYTVLFRENGKIVFQHEIKAKNEEEAVADSMFVPYFYDIEYDEMEVR